MLSSKTTGLRCCRIFVVCCLCSTSLKQLDWKRSVFSHCNRSESGTWSSRLGICSSPSETRTFCWRTSWRRRWACLCCWRRCSCAGCADRAVVYGRSAHRGWSILCATAPLMGTWCSLVQTRTACLSTATQKTVSMTHREQTLTCYFCAGALEICWKKVEEKQKKKVECKSLGVTVWWV